MHAILETCPPIEPGGRRYDPRGSTAGYVPRSESRDPSFELRLYVGHTAPNQLTVENKPQLSASEMALARLRTFLTWSSNWDGEGAPAPVHSHIDLAINLLSLLHNTHRDFSVHLTADSHPVFFPRWLECRGEIVIEDEEHLSFWLDQRGLINEGYMIPFDGKKLPEKLKAAIYTS